MTFQAYEIDKMYTKLENFSSRKWLENDKTKTKKKIRHELDRTLDEAQKLLDILGPESDDEDEDNNNLAVKFENGNTKP